MVRRRAAAVDEEADDANVPPDASDTQAPSYLVEIAKSGRSQCKRCDDLIPNQSVRIGVIVEADWGLHTHWQHLGCTIFHKSLTKVEDIDGFQELEAANRDLVQQRYACSLMEVDLDYAMPIDPDEMVRKTWSKPLEPTADLLMPLLPYQKEGLGWMVHQELNDVHGGILADEMGMGKTIQAIAMMLYNRPSNKNQGLRRTWDESDHAHGIGEDVKLPRAGTLIVLPTVAIRQWQLEIARFTAEKALTVKIYHGSDRNTTVEDLMSYDVIITSYKIVEIEYRKATAGAKVTCRICNKKFYPDKLRVHRKYFCGESAERTEAQSKTVKKLTRVGQAGAAMDDNISSDDEDGDEGDEPKGRKRKSPASSAVAAKRRKASAVKKAIPAAEEESSEDEIDKQKRMIKEQVAKKNAKGAAKKRRTSIPMPAPVAGTTCSEGDEDCRRNSANSVGTIAAIDLVDTESDEDEIAKQKRMIKEKIAKREAKAAVGAKAGQAMLTQRRGKAVIDLVDTEDEYEVGHQTKAVKTTNESRVKKSTVARSRPTPRKTTGVASDIEDSDSDSSGSSYSERALEDDESDSTDNVPKKGPRQKVAPKKTHRPSEEKASKTSKTSVKGSPAPKGKGGKGKQAKKKFPGESNSSEEENIPVSGVVDDGEDSELERDIRDALKQHAKQMKATGAPQKSLLHAVSWFRVILDEAHLIKDRSTSTAKAVFHLVSLNKWCLTGTPLQNRVGELYSLIRFLRIDPHAYYFCRAKGCDCKSLHYRFTHSMCDDCQHSVTQHYCFFNKHILNPIKRSGYIAEGRKAMLKLKQQVLDEILLRRTKTSRADDIQLPMRVVKVRQERLDDKEEDFYQALYTQSQAQFNTYLANGTVLNNYAHIFDILIRLRQAVDHPYLVIHSEAQTAKNAADRAAALSAGVGADEDKEVEAECCDLCREPVDTPVHAACGHLFCSDCIKDYMGTLNGSPANGRTKAPKLLCPECSEPLSVMLESATDGGNKSSVSVWDASKHRRKSILKKIDLSKFQSSTKMEALMEELFHMEQEEFGCKAIVFSQFVNMLDLLEYRIQQGGISCVKLSGSMSLEQRDKSIRAFKEMPDVKVLLISLKAGGVALNLTVASRIFLMDPWWNPAAEMQAIDRTHRIGQFRPIVATRFIIENSIEERILRLQDKKKLVFDGTVGGDSGSMTKLTVDDMRFLFQ